MENSKTIAGGAGGRKTITKAQLIAWNACEDGLDRFIGQTGGTDKPVEIISLIGGKNTIGDLVWLAQKMFGTGRIRKFACDCALINVELIKPYTDKYDLIADWLKDPTGKDAMAADKASCGAWAATADSFVGWAARAVSWAACASYLDGRAANCAANAAARAAEINREEVHGLLREMFNE